MKRKGTYVCKGDPAVDALTWYVAEDGIRGYAPGESDPAIWLQLECARDESQYMPAKVRLAAIQQLEVQSQ